MVAADDGHEGVVWLLLQRDDVNLNSQNSRSLTPLMIAAEEGHNAVVKLLLGGKHVNPSICTAYD